MPNLKKETKCNRMKMSCSRNNAKCTSRNNGMLRNDLQTDFGTYFS